MKALSMGAMRSLVFASSPLIACSPVSISSIASSTRSVRSRCEPRVRCARTALRRARNSAALCADSVASMRVGHSPCSACMASIRAMRSSKRAMRSSKRSMRRFISARSHATSAVINAASPMKPVRFGAMSAAICHPRGGGTGIGERSGAGGARGRLAPGGPVGGGRLPWAPLPVGRGGRWISGCSV